MQIVLLALSALVPFAENPRLAPADPESLRASIQAFGLFKPFLVWQGEGHPEGETGPVVIGGNQRLGSLLAMKEAGLFDEGPIRVTLASGAEVVVDPEAIPCIVFPGSWAEAKLVALRDNAQDGDWDWEALPSYVEDLRGLLGEEFDLGLTGFDAQMLADLEALATDPLVGVDQIGGGTTPPGDGGQAPEGGGGKKGKPDDHSSLTRKSARVVLGNIRGEIPVETYERLAALVKDASVRLGTTDLPPIMADLCERLEAHPKPPRRAAKKEG